MPKFRKKPVTISAEQWFPDRPVSGVLQPLPNSQTQFDPHIVTLESKLCAGPHLVSPGDWIVTGVKGEKYPVKDEIFRLTYEPVDEEAEKAFLSNKNPQR
ncbi:hypothetical protein [Chroococcidiopsis sp.]|uniref:hypothetical protein n=1 Tax=Chroococcidiopsis sp. TaxID=3088168 RepID=UPI003F2BD79B